jgi:tRNA(Ile)-lysidine synthase
VSVKTDTETDLLLTAALALPDKPQVIGVAVSGGSDSLAALHVMAQTRHDVRAVTVNHNLRSGSVDEAAFVGKVCAGLGIAHTTLVWDHGPVSGNLMDAARRARYGLIADWARAQGISQIVLAHTADDQAETLLIGLARAAGLDGLCGMRPAWAEDGVTFQRPFLGTTRALLRDYLLRKSVTWVDDPTNDDERFTRIKARRVLDALKPLGITADQLARVADNLAMAQSVVRVATADAAREVVQERTGGLVIDRGGFHALQFELQRRILIGAFAWMSGATHPPRADAVDRVRSAIIDGRDATLSGCRIRVTDTAIRILREPKAVALVEGETTAPWDHRWHLEGPHAPDLTIRALGDGLRQIANWRETGLPRDALIVTPAVWQGDALIAAPLAGFAQGWTATLRPGFASFLLSH